MPNQSGSLLGHDDPAPFEILNENGKGHSLFVCDHASREVPKSLGTLGLPDEERKAFRQAAEQEWQEWAGKNEMTQKVYDAATGFLTARGQL